MRDSVMEDVALDKNREGGREGGRKDGNRVGSILCWAWNEKGMGKEGKGGDGKGGMDIDEIWEMGDGIRDVARAV
jgi:hypothetical protein